MQTPGHLQPPYAVPGALWLRLDIYDNRVKMFYYTCVTFDNLQNHINGEASLALRHLDWHNSTALANSELEIRWDIPEFFGCFYKRLVK